MTKTNVGRKVASLGDITKSVFWTEVEWLPSTRSSDGKIFRYLRVGQTYVGTTFGIILRLGRFFIIAHIRRSEGGGTSNMFSVKYWKDKWVADWKDRFSRTGAYIKRLPNWRLDRKGKQVGSPPEECPRCGSDNVFWGSPEPSDNEIYRYHNCADCDYFFTETYTFAYWTEDES